jgi:3-oxoacyl-[acyl-carrier-protein] synthase III
MGSAIVGLGSGLPEQVVTSDELTLRFGLPVGWIEERTGISARRVADSSETLAVLGTRACREALAHAGVEASTVDCIIVATCTADTQIPATAPQIQAALGCTDAFAFDLDAGCSGFLYALNVADALIENKQCDTILVCGADIMSRVIDPEDPRSYVLFGDGSGAAVVASWGTSALGPFELAAEGSRPDLLEVDRGTGLLRMDGREVYRRAVDAMAKSVASVCETSGKRLLDIDLLVAHQANARIITAVGERLDLDPSRAFIGIERVGNTSAASIPLALLDAAASDRLHAGDNVVLTAFGAGFTWGAAMARWVAPQVEQRALVEEAVSV